MDRWFLGSVQMNLYREEMISGPDPTWHCCYRGHRKTGRQRARGEYGHSLGHHIVAGCRCDALIVPAATQSERAQWPSPTREEMGRNRPKQ